MDSARETRPRWHDVLIAASIVGLLGAGVWALWWDDVRHALHPGAGSGSAVDRPQAAIPQT